MNLFEFELTFALPDPAGDPEEWLDALFEAGCDDALVSTGQHGYVALDFSRWHRTARGAMQSAIRDVKKAIPGAELLEAKPDLVSLTDVSRVFGFSRQAARKLATDAKKEFPDPVHTGQTALWHLFDVLSWAARKRQPLAVKNPGILLEVAASAVRTNVEVQVRRVKQVKLVHAADADFVVVHRGRAAKQKAVTVKKASTKKKAAASRREAVA